MTVYSSENIKIFPKKIYAGPKFKKWIFSETFFSVNLRSLINFCEGKTNQWNNNIFILTQQSNNT